MTQHELTQNRLGNELGAIAASGGTALSSLRDGAASVSTLRASIAYRGGPSPEFVALTRNPELAANPPSRFEPTIKQPGDVVL